MKPVLCHLGFFTIYTYGVFVALSFLVSTSLLMREARRRGFDDGLIYNLCIVLLVGGIISARIFYIGLNWEIFKSDPLETIMLQHGGLVWFGGLIGALASGLIFMKITRMPLAATCDLFVPFVALAQGIGRIGCFFNGCCYGKHFDSGVFFPALGQVLFPSQLLDSLTLLLIFVILRMTPVSKAGGRVFVFYLILASVQRFFIEFVRGDIRPFYASLSIFQWISVGLFFAGLLLWGKASWKK